MISPGRVRVTETVLRDGQQSLAAGRMRTVDMLPALARLDEAGYFALEVWGGATFDVCLRFLDENPWERLRTIRKHVQRTPLRMLLRGQNLVGYRHYADDVVEAFVARAAENGVDIFRVFDALNDIRNLQPAIRAVHRAGRVVEGALAYTESPVHSLEGFVAFARQLADEGATHLCIKDMAGLLRPESAAALVGALVEQIGLPVQLHGHGSSLATYLAAARAGVSVLDGALSPFAGGASLPATEDIVAALAAEGLDSGVEPAALVPLAAHFRGVRERLGGVRPLPGTGGHQIPGGMWAHLGEQLQQQRAEHRLDEVLAETARVREDLGYPPLVTPTSQIIGTQAVFNVVSGARYAIVTREVAEYLRGRYGRPPAPVNAALRRKVVGDTPPDDEQPTARLAPELPGSLEHVAREWGGGLEEALCYALFPGPTTEYLDARRRPPVVAPPLTAAGGPACPASAPEHVRPVAPGAAQEGRAGLVTLRMPMPGTLFELRVAEGEEVREGQLLAVFEAMKMHGELDSPVDGRVWRLLARPGAGLDREAPVLEIAPFEPSVDKSGKP